MFGDKFNIGSLLKNAKKMQEMMQQAQAELDKIEVTGTAGADAVTVVVNAKHYVKKINIDDALLTESKEVLQDLIAAAINDATNKIEEIVKSKMMDANELIKTD